MSDMFDNTPDGEKRPEEDCMSREDTAAAAGDDTAGDSAQAASASETGSGEMPAADTGYQNSYYRGGAFRDESSCASGTAQNSAGSDAGNSSFRAGQPCGPQQPGYAYMQQPPKKKTGLMVFLAIAGCVLLLSLIGLAAAGVYSYITRDDRGVAAGETIYSGEEHLQISDTPDFSPTQSGAQLSVREIAEKVKPSVVGIIVQLQNGTGAASGIIVSADGYILTNAHVVDGAQLMTVVLDNEEKTQYTAKLVGVDEATELAVIKVDAEGLTPAEFGDSDALAAGDQVVAIGNPGGLQFQNTITVGWISAINREMTLDDGRELTLIQHDAAINTGNSGGALVNMYGQVVGINSIKYAPSYYEGLGFAIPIAAAKPVVDQLIAQGYVSGRPQLGITGYNVTERMALASNLPTGVFVASVNEDSDVYAKGLREGDIIIGVGDVRITNMDELNAQKSKLSAGDSIVLRVYRNGQELTIEAILSEAVPQN